MVDGLVKLGSHSDLTFTKATAAADRERLRILLVPEITWVDLNHCDFVSVLHRRSIWQSKTHFGFVLDLGVVILTLNFFKT